MKKTAVVIFSCLCSLAFAQETPSRLTFKEAVKIGLNNNVTLNQDKNQLEFTQINKASRLLQLGPTVQAQGNAFRVDGNSFNQNTGQVVNGVIDFVNANVNASIPIFNGLGQVSSFRQANNANEAQLHQVRRSSQDVIRNVANQYLTCLLDQELIKIDEQNVAAQRVQYDQIKVQVELGSRAEADLFNQEYQVKNAELLLVRSRNRLKNDMATLAQTLQIDPSVAFDLEPITWDLNTILADTVTLEQMYATAMQQRSDLKQADYNERATHFGMSAVKGNYYPSINASASYGSRYNYIYESSNRSFDDQFRKDNRQLSYGVSVTIPIYNALQFRSQVAQSRVQYHNAKLAKKNTEVTVKTDVQRAYQNFNDAKTSYQASSSQLRSAELSYQTEKERFDLGISTIVQLTTANQSFVRAQTDYQNALYTLMFQKLLIDYALGTLNEEDIP